MMSVMSLGRRAVLALPLLLVATRVRTAEPLVVGTLTRLVGSAAVIRAAAEMAAARGMTLQEGDRIVTNVAAKLEITGADGTALTIGEQTTVVLTRLVVPTAARRGSGLLDLIQGILRIRLPGSWSRFEVTTRTAVASVRSTDWIVDAAADNTAVFVVEGRVQVTNQAMTAAVLLDPGFGTDVKADAPPTTPKRWGKPRVDAALARTQIP